MGNQSYTYFALQHKGMFFKIKTFEECGSCAFRMRQKSERKKGIDSLIDRRSCIGIGTRLSHRILQIESERGISN